MFSEGKPAGTGDGGGGGGEEQGGKTHARERNRSGKMVLSRPLCEISATIDRRMNNESRREFLSLAAVPIRNADIAAGFIINT